MKHITTIAAALLAIVPIVGMAKQPPANAYDNYIDSQITSATRLVVATKTQLASCASDEKDLELNRATHFVELMRRSYRGKGATEAGFRTVSLYHDGVSASIGRAMQACAPSRSPFAYLIRDRVKVTAALIDATASCPEDRNLTNARRHLNRMRRIADGNEATAKALTEVSTEQNHAVAFMAKALKACQ